MATVPVTPTEGVLAVRAGQARAYAPAAAGQSLAAEYCNGGAGTPAGRGCRVSRRLVAGCEEYLAAHRVASAVRCPRPVAADFLRMLGGGCGGIAAYCGVDCAWALAASDVRVLCPVGDVGVANSRDLDWEAAPPITELPCILLCTATAARCRQGQRLALCGKPRRAPHLPAVHLLTMARSSCTAALSNCTY